MKKLAQREYLIDFDSSGVATVVALKATTGLPNQNIPKAWHQWLKENDRLSNERKKDIEIEEMMDKFQNVSLGS